MVNSPIKLDAQAALNAAVKLAAEQIERIGGMEQFIRPGEYVAAERAETLPKPSISAEEYIRRFKEGEFQKPVADSDKQSKS